MIQSLFWRHQLLLWCHIGAEHQRRLQRCLLLVPLQEFLPMLSAAVLVLVAGGCPATARQGLALSVPDVTKLLLDWFGLWLVLWVHLKVELALHGVALDEPKDGEVVVVPGFQVGPDVGRDHDVVEVLDQVLLDLDVPVFHKRVLVLPRVDEERLVANLFGLLVLWCILTWIFLRIDMSALNRVLSEPSLRAWDLTCSLHLFPQRLLLFDELQLSLEALLHILEFCRLSPAFMPL